MGLGRSRPSSAAGEDRTSYWRLVEPIWDTVSIYHGPKAFLEQFEAAPEASRTLFAAHWCQSEIDNGGLYQFFCNSTGVLALEAAEAFRCWACR